jgi:hypothetical protein
MLGTGVLVVRNAEMGDMAMLSESAFNPPEIFQAIHF